jgi:hypothetical protein
MAKLVARTEELPVIPLRGAMAPTSVTAGQTEIYPAQSHPRMMVVSLGVTGFVAGA